VALVPCEFCPGEHAAGTARCPVTGALLRRPKVVPPPPPPDPTPTPDPGPVPAPGGGPDPHAALFGTPSPAVTAAVVATSSAPTVLRVLPDGPVLRLEPGHVVPLGREASPIAHVCSDNVSRRHAEVRVEPDRTVVVDVGSVNGTFVNDRRLAPGQPHPVLPGDTLRLGSDPALRLSFTSDSLH
jgi:hypothetical protein